MTNEEIIKMARKASGDDWGIFKDFMPEIECFAALVAAAEREACAKEAESYVTMEGYGDEIAYNIRARGE